MRDHRANAALAGRLPIGLGVISLIGDDGARPDVGSDIEQGLELTAVAGLATCQVEVERIALEVGFEVDFRREPAARAAKSLTVLPPFAPAAETCARTTVESNIWTRLAVSLCSASN